MRVPNIFKSAKVVKQPLKRKEAEQQQQHAFSHLGKKQIDRIK